MVRSVLTEDFLRSCGGAWSNSRLSRVDNRHCTESVQVEERYKVDERVGPSGRGESVQEESEPLEGVAVEEVTRKRLVR